MYKTQKLEFTVDKNIIYSIIKSQAGTLSKAFLELVMNSIDASATKVEITFNNKSFKVIDNGKGFQSEDEIHNYFKTFGTPHEEGDAIYGKFRMGRGQIMAFSKNTWRTNEFEMEVDVLNKGIEFNFKKGLEYFSGVSIKGTFYEELSSMEYNSILKELKDYLKYSQISTIINDIEYSETKTRWTFETEEAYFKLKKSNEIYSISTLDVYNLGVLVCKYPATKFGISGVIVSKKQLEVNFARNDILVSQCKVWKTIVSTLKKEFLNQTRKKINNKKHFSESELTNLTNIFLSQELPFDEVKSYPIFTDIVGRNFTFTKFNKEKIITISKRHSPLDEIISKNKKAFVLNKLMLERFNVKDIYEFEILINKTLTLYYKDTFIGNKVYVEIEELTKEINPNYIPIEDNKLTKKQFIILKAIRKYQDILLDLINFSNTNYTYDISKRMINIGKSDIANAWTNGKSFIYINKEILKECDRGINGWLYIANLIIHEYLHNNSENLHNLNFYENFHQIILNPKKFSYSFSSKIDNYIITFCKRANSLYIKELEKGGFFISKSVYDLKSIS